MTALSSDPSRLPVTSWMTEVIAAIIVTLGCATEYVALGAQATSALPGTQSLAYGVMLGILTAVIGVPLSALGASTRPMISGPRVAATVLMSNLIAALWHTGSVAALGIKAVVALAGVAVVIAGVMQLALGRWGSGIPRKIPVPVLSGLLFGVAGLAIADQLNFVSTCVFDWHVVTVAIVGAGLGAHFLWKSLSARRLGAIKLPPGLSMFVALIVSALAYYTATAFLPAPPSVCRLVGVAGLDLAAWRPLDISLWASLGGALTPLVCAQVLIYGLLIGIMASLDTVIAVSSIEALTHRRGIVRRDLYAFGALNCLLGVLALLPCVGSVTRSTMAIAAGAKTRAVAVIHALLVLAALTIGVGLVAMLPKLSAAVVVIVMSLDMIDDWSKSATALAFSEKQPRAVIGNAMWLFVAVAATTLVTGQPGAGFLFGAVAGTITALRRPRGIAVHMTAMPSTATTLDTRSSTRMLPAANPPAAIESAVHVSVVGALVGFNVDRAVVSPVLSLLDQSQPPDSVMIDLAQVHRIDASACRALAQLSKLCASKGCALRLSASGPVTDAPSSPVVLAALRTYLPEANVHTDVAAADSMKMASAQHASA